jgi:hypothetical protein
VNRTEINRDPLQGADPANSSVNANKPIKSASRRKPPRITPEDEKAFRAAAARLELEALKNNNVNQPLPSQRSQPTSPKVYSLYPSPQYVQAAYQTAPNSPTPSQQQLLDMRSILPPRLQALNNKPVDSQVLPPRFQNSSTSIANSLPPRFQTSQVSAPSGFNL